MNRTQGEALVTVGPVSVRRACVADWDAVEDFFAGLSTRTRYLRFFGALTMSPAMLRVLSGGGDADAVVASRNCEIIGHGIAANRASPGGGTAIEIGVVVADAWQRRGIGSALVRTLMSAAEARGATIVAMDVLHANHQVLAMIASHWPGAAVERSADCVTFHVRLALGTDGLPRNPRSRIVASSGGSLRCRLGEGRAMAEQGGAVMGATSWIRNWPAVQRLTGDDRLGLGRAFQPQCDRLSNQAVPPDSR
jgi:GNAT superfamily N-acetyltransferase